MSVTRASQGGDRRRSCSARTRRGESRKESKAAVAWALPTALPSSPIRLPSFWDGNRWVSELKTPPEAEGDSQPDINLVDPISPEVGAVIIRRK